MKQLQWKKMVFWLRTIQNKIESTSIGGFITSKKELTKSNNFYRELKIGSVGEDVKNLQRFLNKNGFPVASSGAGSSGNETTKFGSLTQLALIKFQKANQIFQSHCLQLA